MSPMAPIGRAKAMALVEKDQLPIRFGSPHPFVAILLQEGKYRIRALVVDPAESKAAGEAALAKGDSWMPEHHYALAKPTGKIFVETTTKADLLAHMKTMTWPKDW